MNISREKFLTLVAAMAFGCGPAPAPPAPPVSTHPELKQKPFFQGAESLPEHALLRFGSSAFRHSTSIHQIAFSGDGNTLATGALDGVVRVWNLAGEELANTSFTSHSLPTVALSKDGKRLAASAPGHVVRVVDVATGRAILTLEKENLPHRLAFSPDGSKLAAAQYGRVAVWAVPSGSLVREVMWEGNASSNVLIFKDDTHLFAISPLAEKDEYKLFNVLDGGSEVVLASSLKERRGPSAFDPDKLTLATCRKDHTVVVESLSSGSTQTILPAPDGARPAKTDEEACRAVEFSEQGKFLVTNSPGAGFFKRPLDGSPPVRIAKAAYHTALAISPDGALIAVNWNGPALSLYRSSDGVERKFVGHREAIRAGALSPSGDTFATAGDDGEVIVWSTRDATPRVQFNASSRVVGISLEPSSNSLFVDILSGREVHDLRTGALRETVAVPTKTSPVFGYFTKPEGLLTAEVTDKVIRVKAESPSNIVPFSWSLDATVVAARPSQDGSRLYAAFQNGGVEILDVASRRTIADVAPVGAPRAYVLEVSPNGNVLFLGKESGAISLHRTSDGKLLQQFLGHKGGVLWLGFSPVDKVLYSVGLDGTAFAWDTRNLPELSAEPVSTPPPRVDPTLRARLDAEKLTGYVRMAVGARLFPTLETARSAPKKTKVETAHEIYSPALTVLRDEGDVVFVQTGLEKSIKGFGPVDPSYNLFAYLRREDVLPVLNTPQRFEAADGTGFALGEGLLLHIVGDIRPLVEGAPVIPNVLTFDNVSLSFTAKKKPLALSPQGKLYLCAITPCHFVPQDPHRKAELLPPLKIDGKDMGSPHAHVHDSCDLGVAVRISKDKSTRLVTRQAGSRLEARFAVDGSVLTKDSPCKNGSGGVASLGGSRSPKEETVLWVEGRVAALYPDGRKAGFHDGPPVEIRNATEMGEMFCISRPSFVERVCHLKSQLKTVTVKK